MPCGNGLLAWIRLVLLELNQIVGVSIHVMEELSTSLCENHYPFCSAWFIDSPQGEVVTLPRIITTERVSPRNLVGSLTYKYEFLMKPFTLPTDKNKTNSRR